MRYKGECQKCGASFDSPDIDDPLCGLCEHYYECPHEYPIDLANGDPDAVALHARLEAKPQNE